METYNAYENELGKVMEGRENILPEVTNKEGEVVEDREPSTVEAKDVVEKLRKKYKEKDGKIYEIVTAIQEDDENEIVFDFIFRKPNTASYDRYAKTAATSNTRALNTFILDNICEEQYDYLKETLEEYPAMSLSLGEKLLNMLGLSKETTVKKL